jgi:hypothetical protein
LIIIFLKIFEEAQHTKVVLKRHRNQDYKKNEDKGKAIPVTGCRGP